MKPARSVLVVEDQPGEREALARLLRLESYEVFTARGPREALAHVDRAIGLVISDLRLGRESGVDLLRDWRLLRPETPFIVVTAYGDVESAVAAMKLGAADYLTKPVDPDELLSLVAQTVRRAAHGTAAELNEAKGFDRLVGCSAAMLDVYERIRRVAQSQSVALVLGESGTGKELVAEAIHRHSRRQGPFVAMNIAAVPENLVESELFGHVEGAFTGAGTCRVGRFEAADGGTLFIDEIGDCAPAAQAKLLRVLETPLVTPVGSNDARKIDVRVVAATSRDLSRMAADGEFREDLYYRLNVVTIEVPPLRSRRDDIPLLIETFLEESCSANGRARLALDPALDSWLQSYDWPGNVRQLRNAVESMVVLTRGERLTLDDVPERLRRPLRAGAAESPLDTDPTLDELERSAIEKALDQNGGSRTRAAGALGISVRTLQRKLKAWQQTAEPNV